MRAVVAFAPIAVSKQVMPVTPAAQDARRKSRFAQQLGMRLLPSAPLALLAMVRLAVSSETHGRLVTELVLKCVPSVCVVTQTFHYNIPAVDGFACVLGTAGPVAVIRPRAIFNQSLDGSAFEMEGSPWNLVKTGRFQEAVEEFTAELAAKPSRASHNNRGLAHLHLGNYDDALADFQAADSEGEGSLVGVALWMAGRFREAAEVWARGAQAMFEGRIRSTDAAGGVSIGNLLWFASVRLHDAELQKSAHKLLRKRLRTKQSHAWPGHISRYLLGMITEADVRAAVSTTPLLRERQLCKATFYIGVQSLSAGNTDCYFMDMKLTTALGDVSRLEEEYYLALYEMAHVDQILNQNIEEES